MDRETPSREINRLPNRYRANILYSMHELIMKTQVSNEVQIRICRHRHSDRHQKHMSMQDPPVHCLSIPKAPR